MENTPDLKTDLTLAGVIHDLNNVLQTLVEAADLLAGDPQWASLSAVIVRSVERGKELTLGLQKDDQPPAALLSVLARARSFVEDWLVAGRGAAIDFTCDIDDTIELRRSHSWERVLINLFTNSVRALPNGGTIFIGARRVGDAIELVVSDDGPGIAPQMLPNIFAPHVSSRSDGGLGLHIVQSIVEQEQGQVRAANGANGGAQFTITIPAKLATSHRGHASAHAGE